MEKEIKDILKKVSLGEATKLERDFLETLDDETFYSNLEELSKETLEQEYSSNNYYPTTLDFFIEDSIKKLNRNEEEEFDYNFSEVIITKDTKSDTLIKIKSFSKRRSLLKQFFKKQRLRY